MGQEIPIIDFDLKKLPKQVPLEPAHEKSPRIPEGLRANTCKENEANAQKDASSLVQNDNGTRRALRGCTVDSANPTEYYRRGNTTMQGVDKGVAGANVRVKF